MILFHVSAVLLVRDGFTGRTVEGKNLMCDLDGVPVRPQVKPGGRLVLSGLPEGLCRIRLQAPRFREETVDISVDKGKTGFLYPVLKPGDAYFFRRVPARVALDLGGAEGPVWLSPPGLPECRLVQARAEPGDTRLRLLCKGRADCLPIPGPFLLEDGEKSEICVLESLWDGTAALAAPCAMGHGRGCRLLPAGQYRAERGAVAAVFPRPGELFILCPGRKGVRSVKLSKGDNVAAVSWEQPRL